MFDHCLNVASVANALIKQLPTTVRNITPPSAAVLAALHDVGKIAPGFQAKCERWLAENGLKDMAIRECWTLQESDHGKITHATLKDHMEGQKMWQWAAALGAHHGRLKGAEGLRCNASWAEHRRRLIETIVQRLGPLPTHPPRSAAQLWWLAGLVTVADWIGSDERFFPPDHGLSEQQRKIRALEAVSRIGWTRLPLYVGCDFTQLFPGYEPNCLQQAVINHVTQPGVYVIEAPMGFGKTEAALAAAYRLLAQQQASGLYFALPTQLTSNRIHKRVQAFIDRICENPRNVRLAHSASWLYEEALPALPPSGPAGEDESPASDLARSWFASPRRALLEPFGVGTVDQALLGVTAAKHFFLRQFALAGKVVILDEVHSYDIYTGTLITELVRQLRELNATVIILSATLTRKRRAELLGVDDAQRLRTEYPLVTTSNGETRESPVPGPPARTVAVRWFNPEILADCAVQKAESGHCVLWICNTVSRAQETFKRLRSMIREDGPRIGLLHSRFPMIRREQLEEDWMDALGRNGPRPQGCILVATQVVEQSVDVDADLLITDLAPTDMLFQRIGRLWRHHRFSRPASDPEVWIEQPTNETALTDGQPQDIRAALGPGARVYAPYILLRTWKLWRNQTSIQIPDRIRDFLEQSYSDPDAEEPQAWAQLREDLDSRRERMKGLAWNATQLWDRPLLHDEEGIHTRYESVPMGAVLPIYELEDNGQSAVIKFLDKQCRQLRFGDWNFETAKCIHRCLIRAPCWALKDGLAKAPAWLRQNVDRAVIAILQDDGTLKWPHSELPSGLSYHEDLGLVIDTTRVPRGGLGEEFDESCF